MAWPGRAEGKRPGVLQWVGSRVPVCSRSRSCSRFKGQTPTVARLCGRRFVAGLKSACPAGPAGTPGPIPGDVPRRAVGGGVRQGEGVRGSLGNARVAGRLAPGQLHRRGACAALVAGAVHGHRLIDRLLRGAASVVLVSAVGLGKGPPFVGVVGVLRGGGTPARPDGRAFALRGSARRLGAVGRGFLGVMRGVRPGLMDGVGRYLAGAWRSRVVRVRGAGRRRRRGRREQQPSGQQGCGTDARTRAGVMPRSLAGAGSSP